MADDTVEAARQKAIFTAHKLTTDLTVEQAIDALIAAVRAENRAVEACAEILKLSAGWDANGCVGPKPPLSWETVGRLALDHARYAIRPS